MTKKKRTERYPIERSCLFRLGTQRKLAELVGFKRDELRKLASYPHQHYTFREEIINGKLRRIQCPKGRMRRLHERLKNLFNRIVLPEYLHAPRHSRSYISNARAHAGAEVVGKFDIRQFYPSTTREQVFRFLSHELGMVDDVAGLLAKLCTIDERLPFGSPVSPVLAAFVHKDMFDELEAAAHKAMAEMTVFVDDVSFSGEHVPGALMHSMCSIVKRNGFVPHKKRRHYSSHGAIVTGVRLGPEGQSSSNKSHKKMRDSLIALDSTRDPAMRLSLVRRLLGLNSHILRTYSDDHPNRQRSLRQRQWLHNERRQLEKFSPAVSCPAEQVPLTTGDNSIPF